MRGRSRLDLDVPINLAALSGISSLSSGGGEGMAPSPSISTDGLRDTGLEADFDVPGLRVDLVRAVGGAPSMKLDSVEARCCFEVRASRSRRFSRSDVEDFSIS